MWPFDKILVARIKELERNVESLIGQNTVLNRELERAQLKEDDLLERLLTLTGANPTATTPRREVPANPISLGRNRQPWSQVRGILENEAKEKYWESKKKEQDTRKSPGILLDKLEEEVLAEGTEGEAGHG